VLTARIEITDLLLILGERHLRRTLAGYAGGDGQAEDAGHQGACTGYGGGQGLVVAAVVAGVDGALDAPADLAQLLGLGLGQRVEDQAAYLLDMAGRGPHLIGEPVDLITMDLSYLAIADAIGQVDRQMLAPAAQLIALVKPTFELHTAALADQPQQVRAAAQTAARALGNHGWQVLGQQPSPILGAKGAVEILLHAASGLQAQ